jgi:hypothetical protein
MGRHALRGGSGDCAVCIASPAVATAAFIKGSLLPNTQRVCFRAEGNCVAAVAQDCCLMWSGVPRYVGRALGWWRNASETARSDDAGVQPPMPFDELSRSGKRGNLVLCIERHRISARGNASQFRRLPSKKTTRGTARSAPLDATSVSARRLSAPPGCHPQEPAEPSRADSRTSCWRTTAGPPCSRR